MKDDAPQVSIRLARLSERESLEALQRRSSLSNPGDHAALIAHPDAIELPARQIEAGGVFVAEVEGVVMGFAAILPRSDGNAELDGLFVEPERWKRGIGSALVERCAFEVKATGASAIYVVGNPHAEGFYKRCGFQTLERTQTRFGIGLVMRRDIE